MSVTGINSAYARPQMTSEHRNAGWERNRRLSDLKIGDEVALRITSKLSDQRFMAAWGNSHCVVQSPLGFVVGQTVKATVSAVGGIVELKYAGGGQFECVDPDIAAEETQDNGTDAPPLAQAQKKYKVSLSSADLQTTMRVMGDVQDPNKLAASAIYLSKLGVSVDESALRSLYSAQVWSDDTQRHAGAVDITAMLTGIAQGDTAAHAMLGKLLGDAVEILQPAGSTDTAAHASALIESFDDLSATENNSSTTDQQHELAKELLRLQDSGALAYHYGSIPVLVAGQLVELDLVLFHEREAVERPQGLRKLVMTLKTEAFGRVEIVAQSFENTLSVSFGTQSPQATETLAQRAQEVRALVGRLGWNVDSICYRLSADPKRAAEQVVCHVLSAGSLDAVV